MCLYIISTYLHIYILQISSRLFSIPRVQAHSTVEQHRGPGAHKGVHRRRGSQVLRVEGRREGLHTGDAVRRGRRAQVHGGKGRRGRGKTGQATKKGGKIQVLGRLKE